MRWLVVELDCHVPWQTARSRNPPSGVGLHFSGMLDRHIATHSQNALPSRRAATDFTDFTISRHTLCLRFAEAVFAEVPWRRHDAPLFHTARASCGHFSFPAREIRQRTGQTRANAMRTNRVRNGRSCNLAAARTGTGAFYSWRKRLVARARCTTPTVPAFAPVQVVPDPTAEVVPLAGATHVHTNATRP